MIKNIKADILIIGAGPAGLTAAIYAARAGKNTLVLEGRSSSRLAIGYEIENYPGFQSVNSHELLEKFRSHALHFGAEILSGDANAFGLDSGPKYVTTQDSFIEARAVILATGKPFSRQRMIPGEERLMGQGVSYCATCDGPLYRGSDVAALGYSEEAKEDVLALSQVGCRVHWIMGNKSSYLSEEDLNEFRKRGIHPHPRTEIAEIIGEKRVVTVVLKTADSLEELPVAGVFIFREIPTAPLFIKAGLSLDHGQCVVVDRAQRTNLEGVFAAGDVTCGGLQIASAVGEGCVAAMQALAFLRK